MTIIVIYGLIAVILLCFCAMSVISHTALSDHLPLFLILATLTQCLAIALFFRVKKTYIISNNIVMMLAFIVSCIGVFGHPIFEDDYFRYLWDGYVFYHFGSPYGFIPEAFFTDDTITEPFQTILGYINHPSLPTIYGPTSQYSFLAAYIIDPGNITILQLFYAVANMIIVYICLHYAAPHYVLLYVFSPLIFKETLLTAHPDGFAVYLLLAAYWVSHKKHYIAAGCLAGLSIGAKIFALLLVPFLVIKHPIKVIFGCALALSLLYIPIIINGASEFTSLRSMATDWEFNSALWGVLTIFFSDNIVRFIMAIIIISCSACLAWSFWYRKRHMLYYVPRGDIVFGVFLLCLPVINPWYVVWVLPFAVIHPSVTAWFASFIILLSYVVPLYLPTLDLDGNYDQPVIIRWVEFGSLACVFTVEYWWRKKNNIFSNIFTND